MQVIKEEGSNGCKEIVKWEEERNKEEMLSQVSQRSLHLDNDTNSMLKCWRWRMNFNTKETPLNEGHTGLLRAV